VDQTPSGSRADIVVPTFVGMQALNAWLAGHDAGLLRQGPDPDSPHPLLNGVVVAQRPLAGTYLARWDPVTVWVRQDPAGGSGVREPLCPPPHAGAGSAEESPGPGPDLDPA
jgi:hypothetical protein